MTAPIPTGELERRYTRLQRYLGEAELDAVVIVQNADLFYFTGTIQSGTLYVPTRGEPLYLVRKDSARARRESSLGNVLPITSLREVPVLLARHGHADPARLGFELDVLPVNHLERYRRIFARASFVDASALIRRVRMVKSQYEIEQMKAAAVQADQVYRSARQILREGMTDLELAAELEHVARLAGHPGLIRMRSFNGEMLFAHVYSGPDSAVPAYLDTPLGGVGPHPSFGQGAGVRKIGRHEPIIIDSAGAAEGYLVDQTRVFALGDLPDDLLRAYADMRRIQELMKGLAAPGVVCGDLYQRCLDEAEALGYRDHFMGAKGSQVRFIGHGVGVEIDEWPLIARGVNDMTLEPGMTFAFEPKAVFPGRGAVGIENTFVVRPDGLEQLTYSDERLAVLD